MVVVRCHRACLLLFLLLALLASGCGPDLNAPGSERLAGEAASAHDTRLKRVEVDMLTNIKLYGFNADPTINGGLGGLLVNWRYGSRPLEANVNGTGEPDADSGKSPRHDPLTDLRYIHNLWSYHVRYPADTTFVSEMRRYTPIIKHEFAHAQNERGWLYDTFMELYALSHDAFYREAAFSLAQGYARSFHAKAGMIFKVNSATPHGTYRVDLALESACALLEAGTQFGAPQWTHVGLQTLHFLYAHAYIPHYHTFPSQMDQVILKDGSANPQESFYYAHTAHNGTVIGSQVRMGNVSQMAISLLNAYRVTHNSELLAKAIDLLDPLTASKNALGLWDSDGGGYFFGIRFTGSSPRQPGTILVEQSKREAGRQAIMLQAFHLANGITQGRYRAMERLMLDVVLKHIYIPAIHGVPYIVNENWSFQRFHNGTLDDMVTTEAMGAVLESLFSLER